MKSYLSTDLHHIVQQVTPALWECLNNERILITGGTGFFGCWLIESFLWAKAFYNLNSSVIVLTRNKQQYRLKYPHLAKNPALSFFEGDVKNFEFPSEHFSYIIHAATDTSNYLNTADPLRTWDTIVDGTKNVLEFARQCGVKKVLFTSSGAVYGKQPATLSHIPETYTGQPQLHQSLSTYALGKSAAEHLCALYAKQYNLDIKIARCFSFIGPYQELSANFAACNFIKQGLNGETIVVAGDGSPYRSYLYAADMASWLWTILFRGKTIHPYNVGSDEAISIKELAQIVAKSFEPQLEVKIIGSPISSELPERYVPDVSRARHELGLISHFKLADMIRSSINWYQNSKAVTHAN